MGDIAGVCSICNKPARTLYTCWRCGALACGACFDPEGGLCIRCSPKKKGEKWTQEDITRKWKKI